MNPDSRGNHSLSISAPFSAISELVAVKNEPFTSHHLNGGTQWCKWKPNSLPWLGKSPKILKFHLRCDKSLCSTLHSPLAVDWWGLLTSSYLITAGRGPVRRAGWDSICSEIHQSVSFSALHCVINSFTLSTPVFDSKIINLVSGK